MIPACVIRQGMEDVFKLTPKEYAEMLGISTSAVRKQRLKGQLKNEFLEKNGKYLSVNKKTNIKADIKVFLVILDETT